MKLMKLFLVMTFFVTLQAAFAQISLNKLKNQYPDASNREILKSLYESSQFAAELTDFDKGDSISNQKCVIVLSAQVNKDKLFPLAIRTIVKVVPSNGPLFPSRAITKVAGSAESNLVNGRLNNRFNKMFDYITIEKNSYDLIVSQAKNSIQPQTPNQFMFRKNGNLISFKFITYKKGIDHGPIFNGDINEDYGYCWRN